jgi:hypothetical protein
VIKNDYERACALERAASDVNLSRTSLLKLALAETSQHIMRMMCYPPAVETSGNGQGESRLDRIERLLGEHVIETQEAHKIFMQEYQLLLRAQVVMADGQLKFDAQMAQINTKMLELQEKLDGLIHVVDGMIHKGNAE